MSRQAYEVRENPSEPWVLPAPKARSGLQELVIPAYGAGDMTAGFP